MSNHVAYTSQDAVEPVEDVLVDWHLNCLNLTAEPLGRWCRRRCYLEFLRSSAIGSRVDGGSCAAVCRVR